MLAELAEDGQSRNNYSFNAEMTFYQAGDKVNSVSYTHLVEKNAYLCTKKMASDCTDIDVVLRQINQDVYKRQGKSLWKLGIYGLLTSRFGLEHVCKQVVLEYPVPMQMLSYRSTSCLLYTSRCV